MRSHGKMGFKTRHSSVSELARTKPVSQVHAIRKYQNKPTCCLVLDGVCDQAQSSLTDASTHKKQHHKRITAANFD
jgi:hypothetical protein